MLVGNNSFDLWQKDIFFSAAEEVQQSADIMESSYRTWLRQREDGLKPVVLDELCRELQTALGTAKWQLEEFEKAVKSSYRNHSNDTTTMRHMQFIDAIGGQISSVEEALKESFNKELNQPFRWVNLDEEERDDLANFLSGTTVTSQCTNGEAAKLGSSPRSPLPENMKKSGNNEGVCVIEIDANESHGTSDDTCGTTERKNGTRRVWNSPDIDPSKVIIDDQDEHKNGFVLGVETTPKEKGFKPFFWNINCGDHRNQTKGGILNYNQIRGINWVNQIVKRVGSSPRKLHMQLQSQRICSLQFTLVLMLTIFLIVPFVLYST